MGFRYWRRRYEVHNHEGYVEKKIHIKLLHGAKDILYLAHLGARLAALVRLGMA